MRKITEIFARQREAMAELERQRIRMELTRSLEGKKPIVDRILKIQTRIAELGWVLELGDGRIDAPKDERNEKEEADNQNLKYRRGWRL